MDFYRESGAEEQKRIALMRDWPTSGNKTARYGGHSCRGYGQMRATSPYLIVVKKGLPRKR
jgi:hypothetical protein